MGEINIAARLRATSGIGGLRRRVPVSVPVRDHGSELYSDLFERDLATDSPISLDPVAEEQASSNHRFAKNLRWNSELPLMPHDLDIVCPVVSNPLRHGTAHSTTASSGRLRFALRAFATCYVPGSATCSLVTG